MIEYDYIILESEEQHFELSDPEKWREAIKILCEEQGVNLEDFILWVYEKHRDAQKFHEEQQVNPKLWFDGPLDLLEKSARMTKIFKEWLQILE